MSLVRGSRYGVVAALLLVAACGEKDDLSTVGVHADGGGVPVDFCAVGQDKSVDDDDFCPAWAMVCKPSTPGYADQRDCMDKYNDDKASQDCRAAQLCLAAADTDPAAQAMHCAGAAGVSACQAAAVPDGGADASAEPPDFCQPGQAMNVDDDDFCPVWASVCTYGAGVYTDESDCNTKYNGADKAGQDCRAAQICRALSLPAGAARDAICQMAAGAVACTTSSP